MKREKQVLTARVISEATALPAELAALTCRCTKHRVTSCVYAGV